MSSIPHFRPVYTHPTDSSAPMHAPDQGRRLTRRTRYREWAEYGAPPLLPIRPPKAAEVKAAVLQRRLSPTQHRVLLHLLTLAGARSWCYFSTVGWMHALGLARTQLLRARRELVEQHILYYQEFPPESEAPYLDQPNNGWIGFYPPAEWLPRTGHWGGARKGAGRPKKQECCNNLISEAQSQTICGSLISESQQRATYDNLGSPDEEDLITAALNEAHHAQAGYNSVIFGASAQNQLDNAFLLRRNQLDNAYLPQSDFPPEAVASILTREGSKKRRPVSSDTGAALAAPPSLVPADEHQGDEPSQTTGHPSRPGIAGAPYPIRTADDGLAPTTAELNSASEHKNKREDSVSPDQLALWHEDIAVARAAEDDAWRALHAAEAALDSAGHGWGSGRDSLVLQRQEASRAYGQARLRREAYELLVALVEQGVAKEEAIERTLDAYPHLRQDVEEVPTLDETVPVEAPAEPEEPVMEAWTLLTEEQWQRALFGQLCRLWRWPTGKDLNREARGRLNRVCKALRQARLRPEYVPLFVAWWQQ